MEPQDSTFEVENVTIDQQAETAAGGETPEDTADYKALFEGMQKTLIETVSALKAQNESLHKQIGILIRNGANVGAHTEPEPEPEQPTYTPLADLGADIGRFER